MKKVGLLISLLLIFASGKSQDTIINKKIIVGALTGVGLNHPIRLTRNYVTEDVGPFHSNVSVTMGLSVSKLVAQKLMVEIAASYSIHNCRFELSPPIYTESKIYSETFKTFNLYALLYKYFRRDYFIFFGTGVDLEIARKSYWIDSQNGFGINLGIGKEFVSRNFRIDLSPNFEMHGVLPFHSEKGQQRLTILGLKAGIRLYPKKALDENIIITRN